ncbi:STY4526/YPO1902 family pathogenicity island replication protein [Microbulbifer sp. GL-2]|uniref:STY4526/YPO1902 family pathogenicity island replication protein n=1 Tax=Microbulbifer sp. GL-2 TaxID=2591606 RepID=UPI001161E805|nr:STY4526/YPO1902 family pathogenicity island replication protein [Microbulbifer sp. GL-2]BBM00774.1 hypothetical protein GL2_08480 [Microbulbifer sp. GL-2]
MSNSNCNSNIIKSICSAAFQALREGDEESITSIGINTPLALELASLTLGEIEQLSEMASHFLDLSINFQVLERMLRRAKEKEEEARLADKLLKLGAATPLMQELLGWSALATNSRKRLLGLPLDRGRPPSLRKEQKSTVISLWWELSERYPNSGSAIHKALLYKEIAEKTGLSLAVIWPVTLSLHCNRAIALNSTVSYKISAA